MVRPGRLLVRVHGSSINHVDLMLRRGRIPLPGARGLGLDFAGTVEEGYDGAGYAKGTPVWGYTGYLPGPTGTAAEYLLVKPECLSVAPRSVGLAGASALPVVALTALQGLRDVLRVRAGERLLIIGGAGGVGSAAIQIGVALGAEVTAACRASAADFCRSAGARSVIRYDTDDLRSAATQFDALLDTAGAQLSTYRRLTDRRGRFATITPQGFARIPLWLATPGPRMRPVVGKPSGPDLAQLAAWVDGKKLRPLVAHSYSLEQIAQAHYDAEHHESRGKRVVAVIPD